MQREATEAVVGGKLLRDKKSPEKVKWHNFIGRGAEIWLKPRCPLKAALYTMFGELIFKEHRATELTVRRFIECVLDLGLHR